MESDTRRRIPGGALEPLHAADPPASSSSPNTTVPGSSRSPGTR
ncbi:hypothetical protein [Actinomadura sp. KC345]|nr:hypothetical protein [Actinomadura sp. KC345]